MTKYNTHILPNSLKVIHLPKPGDIVYCGYAIAAGSRNEAIGEEGLAHFCEHMTFKGTSRRSSIQVINALEGVGGELNAFTGKEETVYYAALLKEHFNKAVDVLTDIVFHSTYPQNEIEKEKEVVCDEIECYRDSPSELIYDEFENELFHGNPIGHNVLGTKKRVRSFTTADCQRFTSRWYTPNRTVFYVIGDVNFPKLISRLERLMGGITAIPEADASGTMAGMDASASIAPTAGTVRTINEYDTHQSHIMLGTAFQSDLSRWRIPLFLTNNILGGPSMNSRFNIALREKRGLVYSVDSLMTTYTDTIMWSVYLGCDHKDANRCIRLIKSQLNRLRRRPLSLSALQAAKTQIKGQLALASTNMENYGIDMAKQYLHRGTLKDTDLLFQRLDAVTSEDIHALMNEVLLEENLFTLILR